MPYQDDISKITNFSPYIETTPIKTLATAGIQRQQQYNEGLELIKKNYQQANDLSSQVYANVDKEYLKSKMSSLQNSLSSSISGDLSNSSLVSNINGVIKSISSDDVVKAAITSSLNIRAGYDKKAELAKKGETDKNNDDYYDNFVNSYTQRKSVRDDNGFPISFNASYVPYTDVVKKMKEALVGAGENESIAEQLFVTGPDGKPLMQHDRQGRPIGFKYADVKTIEKITSNKDAVLSALNTVFAQGDVKQQLSIDGWANYRNVSPQELVEPYTKAYNAEKAVNTKKLEGLEELLIATNLSDEQRQKINSGIKTIELNMADSDKKYKETLDLSISSPDQFKQNVYSKQYKQNLYSLFDKEKTSFTTETNPGKQQENWQQTFNFGVQKHNDEIAVQNRSAGLAADKNKREWMEFYRDSEQDPQTGNWYKKVSARGGAKPNYNPNDIYQFKAGTPGDAVSAIDIQEKNITSLQDTKFTQAFNLYSDIVRESKKNPNISSADIKKSLELSAAKQGITQERYLDRWASNIINKYKELGLILTTQLQNSSAQYQQTVKTLNTQTQITEKAKKEAYAESGITKEQLASIKPIDIQMQYNEKTDTYGNYKVNFNAQDAFDYNYIINNKVQIGNSEFEKKAFNSSEKRLAEKFGTDFRTVLRFTKAYDLASQLSNDKTKNFIKLYNEKLSNVVGVGDAVAGTVASNNADFDDMKRVTSSFLSASGTNRSGVDDFNQDEALKLVGDAKSIDWKAYKPTSVNDDWKGEITIVGKTGAKQTFNVNRTELETFTNGSFKPYYNQPVTDLIRSNNNTKSTNSVKYITDPTAWQTSFYKTYEANPDIKANGYEHHADISIIDGKYHVSHYIKTPTSTEFKLIENPIPFNSENAAEAGFKALTANQLAFLIKEKEKNNARK